MPKNFLFKLCGYEVFQRVGKTVASTYAFKQAASFIAKSGESAASLVNIVSLSLQELNEGVNAGLSLWLGSNVFVWGFSKVLKKTKHANKAEAAIGTGLSVTNIVGGVIIVVIAFQQHPVDLGAMGYGAMGVVGNSLGLAVRLFVRPEHGKKTHAILNAACLGLRLVSAAPLIMDGLVNGTPYFSQNLSNACAHIHDAVCAAPSAVASLRDFADAAKEIALHRVFYGTISAIAPVFSQGFVYLNNKARNAPVAM